MPLNSIPSSGIAFHSLQATSQALQPMQTDVSVKNPTRSGGPGGRRRGPGPVRDRSAGAGPSCPILHPCCLGDSCAPAVLRDQLRQVGPRGRRPGRMSAVSALSSWMWAFGSSAMAMSSLAASPVEIPLGPQWKGSPIWWTVRPWTVRGLSRSVTMTRASTALRAVMIVAQPPCSRPRSAASCGESSQKNSGWSSER